VRLTQRYLDTLTLDTCRLKIFFSFDIFSFSRFYYNNNNNNNKNIPVGHAHHQRYNAAAAAAVVAVELLSSGVPASTGSGDSLTSCKKRKRRTSFTPHALELLNGHFERNTHPSGTVPYLEILPSLYNKEIPLFAIKRIGDRRVKPQKN